MNISKYIELYRKDLILKNYSRNTIENYSSQVFHFLNKHNSAFTHPEKITEQVIKDYLLEAKAVNSRKHRISALKLFYKFTIKQPLKLKNIEYPRSEKKLPIVLSQNEIQRMFDVCDNLKHKVILGILYSCGLRVGELINLKWSHIDRSRMVINVVGGKGAKDRQVMLSETILRLLEKYYYEYRPKEYVLNDQFDLQYSERSVGQVVKQLARKAGIKKQVWTHLIRHCSFTHMVEQGVDINLIQRIAGHNSPKTTAIYTHISDSIVSKIYSPINSIRVTA